VKLREPPRKGPNHLRRSAGPKARPLANSCALNSRLAQQPRRSVVRVWPCRAIGASAIHVRCIDKLTEDAVREIEQIHSSWIEFEVAGEDHSLMALCSDDIELWPPDAQPVLGRAAVSAQLARGTTRIHGIEITNRRIRGSNETAYLTSSYKATFSSAEDSTPKQALGSHLWILEKRAGRWVVTLVSWSLWGRAAISGTRQPPPFPSAGSTS
jgi:ketosteroid isomerase-like protein